MHSLTSEQIQGVLNHVMIYTTQQMADLHLEHHENTALHDACTVNVIFEGNCDVKLSLCADRTFLVRLTQGVLQEETITEQDMQDTSKEYLNVICGQLIAQLFPLKYKPTLFQFPVFQPGNHIIREQTANMYEISYTNDFDENAVLVIAVSPEPVPSGMSSRVEGDKQICPKEL